MGEVTRSGGACRRGRKREAAPAFDSRNWGEVGTAGACRMGREWQGIRRGVFMVMRSWVHAGRDDVAVLGGWATKGRERGMDAACS